LFVERDDELVLCLLEENHIGQEMAAGPFAEVISLSRLDIRNEVGNGSLSSVSSIR